MKKNIIAFGLVFLFGSNLFGAVEVTKECIRSLELSKNAWFELKKQRKLGNEYAGNIAYEVGRSFCYDAMVKDCTQEMLDIIIFYSKNSKNLEILEILDSIDTCKYVMNSIEKEESKKNKKKYN